MRPLKHCHFFLNAPVKYNFFCVSFMPCNIHLSSGNNLQPLLDLSNSHISWDVFDTEKIILAIFPTALLSC